MSLGYTYYRSKWIHLSILTVAFGAFLCDYARGEAKMEPGVVPLLIVLAVASHVGLLTLMVRARRKEREEKKAMFAAIVDGTSPWSKKIGGLTSGQSATPGNSPVSKQSPPPGVAHP